MNKERNSRQARTATSAGEVRQAKCSTSAEHSRYASTRNTQGEYASVTLIEQCGRYMEGEARQERYAEKDVWPGTNHTNKSEQARLDLDGVKPMSKITTEIDKSEDSDGTGTEPGTINGTGTEQGKNNEA